MRDRDDCPRCRELEGWLRPLVVAMAKAIAPEIAAELARTKLDTHIDQTSEAALAELRISARVFLQAARRGEFPTSTRGRKRVAKRRDVEAWLNRPREKPARDPARPLTKAEIENEERVACGLAPKPLDEHGNYDEKIAKILLRKEVRASLGIVPATAEARAEDAADERALELAARRQRKAARKS